MFGINHNLVVIHRNFFCVLMFFASTFNHLLYGCSQSLKLSVETFLQHFFTQKFKEHFGVRETLFFNFLQVEEPLEPLNSK